MSNDHKEGEMTERKQEEQWYDELKAQFERIESSQAEVKDSIEPLAMDLLTRMIEEVETVLGRMFEPRYVEMPFTVKGMILGAGMRIDSSALFAAFDNDAGFRKLYPILVAKMKEKVARMVVDLPIIFLFDEEKSAVPVEKLQFRVRLYNNLAVA